MDIQKKNLKKTKRTLDCLLTIPATVVALPIFIIISIWIWLDSPGPIYFKQKRVGLGKTYFEILKFRTMRTDTPQNMPTHRLKNPEQYITRSGRFLRKTSLDELPQLFNILRGDMSLVGPRPALWNQYDLIAERDKYGANDVLPGLTGWAQIHGRDTITIEEKAKLDGYYVENQSLWLDIRCLLQTVVSVLKREGVQEGGPDAAHTSETAEKQVKEPLVSIVTATHHRDFELKRALESLEKQTYRNLEIILVDDNAEGKWNKKAEAAVEKWKKESRIPLIYIQNAVKCGSAKSRNIGIEAASGEYITFLDDDDEYCPEKVKCQVEHMLTEQSDFSITDLALYNEKGKLEEKRTRHYLEKVSGYEVSALLEYHLMYHMTATDTLMFRADYLKKIGGFPPIDVGDEFYLMKEAITQGGKFSYLKRCDVKALVHSETEGLSSREKKIAGENTLYEYKKQFFPQMKKSAVRQIRMRHHLVLAYAYLRNREYRGFVKETVKAAAASPLGCVKMIVRR